MNILFIGDLRTQARSYQRYIILKQLGHKMVGVNRNQEYDDKALNNLSRLTNKFGYPLDLNKLNKRVLNITSEYNDFNIIWLDKPLVLFAKTIKILRQKFKDAKIVYNTEDDMMQKHNQSKYFLNSIPCFDYFFTTKSYNLDMQELPSLGVKNIYFNNNTFSSDFHRPLKLSDQDKKEFGCSVGFIGSFETQRAKSIMFLADNNIKVRIFGNGWNNFKSHKNIELMNKPIYGKDLIKSICATKINLNFLRKANRDLQTNRSVEIPACEAFMLAERSNEHLNLFKEGKEAEFFSSNEELLEKIQYYLKNEDKIISISKLARERCLISGYDMKSTLNRMINIIKEDNES